MFPHFQKSPLLNRKRMELLYLETFVDALHFVVYVEPAPA